MVLSISETGQFFISSPTCYCFLFLWWSRVFCWLKSCSSVEHLASEYRKTGKKKVRNPGGEASNGKVAICEI